MTELKPTRDGFGLGLLEAGRKNPRVLALTGDLGDSTRAEWFGKEFPERYFDMGIAEQDMVNTAVGLSLGGWIPFACSFTDFIVCRGLDQIRVGVCYNNANVKILGSHSGISTGPDGATVQSVADIATMRALPHMAVIVPADAEEARKATLSLVDHIGPAFLRVGRNPVPVFTKEQDPFSIGQANLLREGNEVSIIACGVMVWAALQAAESLVSEGISADVLNLHTIKPIDREALARTARKTGAVVTAEEHSLYGGLGSAVAEALVTDYPVPMEFVAVMDTFGESGESAELMETYHLTSKDIAGAVKKVLSRKKTG